MKGKIEKNATLMIKRGDEWRMQMCPYGMGACGDSCPLFGEPVLVGDRHSLSLCRKQLLFKEFEDLR